MGQTGKGNKPNSVTPFWGAMVIYLGPRLPSGSMRPTRAYNGAGSTSALIWPCSGRGLPGDLDCSRPGALLPLSAEAVKPSPGRGTFSPLPVNRSRDRNHRRSIFCGTFRPRRVSPPEPPIFSGRPALWSSDFPPPRAVTAGRRPSTPSRSADLAGGTTKAVAPKRRDCRLIPAAALHRIDEQEYYLSSSGR